MIAVPVVVAVEAERIVSVGTRRVTARVSILPEVRTRTLLHCQGRRYTSDEGVSGACGFAGSLHPACSILSRLTDAIQKLHHQKDCLAPLKELRDIQIESDISPLGVNHSGLIRTMLGYMADEVNQLVERVDRLRLFLHVFAGLSLDANYSSTIAGVGGLSNTSSLKFFNAHQLKCNLQRHPEGTNLSQWKGGTVKMDPHELVQAIELYLVVCGYGGIRVDSEEDSEEDIDNIDAAAMISMGKLKHKKRRDSQADLRKQL